MTLNHLNLAVTDVRASAAFLVDYFGLRPQGKIAPGMALLTDDAGLVLSLFPFDEVEYPGNFHVGFSLATRPEVDALYARLSADGHAHTPPSLQHGSWTFYLTAPGGFRVEVLSRAR